MATFSQNQVRDIIITSAEATESTAKTFIASASVGESRVLKADGSGVPTAVSDFYILSKRKNGDIKKSDIIKANQVKYFRKQAPVTAVAKKITLPIPSTVEAGDVVKIDIVIDQWGSASFEDQYFKFGVYKIPTGFSDENVVDGLVQSLAKNFSREEPKTNGTDTIPTYAVVASYTGADDATAKINAFAGIGAGTIGLGDSVRVTGDTIDQVWVVTTAAGGNFAAAFTLVATYSTYTVVSNPLFTFGKTHTKGGIYNLTVTEKAQPYVLGKKQGRHLVWNLLNDFDATPSETLRVTNPVSGQRIADLEWFCLGNTGDMYREAGYPFNFDNTYDAVATEATGYYVLELGFWYAGDNESVQKSEKQLTIACTDKAEINKLITDIEAGAGITLADFA